MLCLAAEEGGGASFNSTDYPSCYSFFVAVMVFIQAAKLNLPQSSSLASPQVSSLLLDPHSLSLALMHSDSSFSLYPSLSPVSLSSLSPRQTFISAPSSSATFLRLQNPNLNSTPRVLFVVAAAPHHGGAAVLLRFWILRKTQSFAKATALCNQNRLRFDDNKLGAVFNVNHGVSIKLVGSINVFAMHSISNRKIWVFAARMAGDEDDGVTVKLMKCAVIDCCLPLLSISISFEFLILGEENGVRVFPLRPLVKGRIRKQRREKNNLNDGLNNDKFMGQRLNFPNGVIQSIKGSDSLFNNSMIHAYYGVNCHGSENDGGEGSVKLRPVKLRQDSKDSGVCFVEFKSEDIKSFKSKNVPLKSAKAISIKALSPNNFLVLDSSGDLHLSCLSNPALGSEIPSHMKRLTDTMKIQKLAVLPDTSMRMQTVWISDGQHTVNMVALSDMETSVKENDKNDSVEKQMQISGFLSVVLSWIVCLSSTKFCHVENLFQLPPPFVHLAVSCIILVAILIEFLAQYGF